VAEDARRLWSLWLEHGSRLTLPDAREPDPRDLRGSLGDEAVTQLETLRGGGAMSDDLVVILTAGLVATACGLLGPFLVLRRVALMGDAVSHAVLPGIVGVFLLTGSRAPLAGHRRRCRLRRHLRAGHRRARRHRPRPQRRRPSRWSSRPCSRSA
jgi:hypothetical protein